MFRILALLMLVSCPSYELAVAQGAKPQTTGREETEVLQLIASFIRAFDNLDWTAFRSCFADNATVFYPEFFPRRIAGGMNLQQSWQKVFQNIKSQSGKRRAPYMDLKPIDTRVQLMSDTAIVTFHLDHGGTGVGRRTLVLRKSAGTWRIVHLHASNVDFGSGGK